MVDCVKNENGRSINFPASLRRYLSFVEQRALNTVTIATSTRRQLSRRVLF